MIIHQLIIKFVKNLFKTIKKILVPAFQENQHPGIN
jgi:hypothetical protein